MLMLASRDITEMASLPWLFADAQGTRGPPLASTYTELTGS